LEENVHRPSDQPYPEILMKTSDWQRVRFELEEMRARLQAEIGDMGQSYAAFAQSVAYLIESLGNPAVSSRDQAMVYTSSANRIHCERGAAWLSAYGKSSE
jgi:hypothetical protein